MALPRYPSTLRISQIKNEFGGGNKLSNYYAGAGFVPPNLLGYPFNVAKPIPASGKMNVSDFFGAAKPMFAPTGYAYKYVNNGGSYRPGTINLGMMWRTPDVTEAEFNAVAAEIGHPHYGYNNALVVTPGSLMYLRIRFNSDDYNTLSIVMRVVSNGATVQVAAAGADCNGRSGDANKTEAHLFYGASLAGNRVYPSDFSGKRVFWARTTIRKTGSQVNNKYYELFGHVSQGAFASMDPIPYRGSPNVHGAKYSFIANSGTESADPEAYELVNGLMVVKKPLMVLTNVNTKGSPTFSGNSSNGVGDILLRARASIVPYQGQLERYGNSWPGIIGMQRLYFINTGSYRFPGNYNVPGLYVLG